MAGLTKRATPDRSKINVEDARQLKYWTKWLGVSKADLLDAVAKVGNAAAAVKKELQGRGLAMADDKKPLKPEDFPVNAEGKKILTGRRTLPNASMKRTRGAKRISGRLKGHDG
jgi:hypothetical protein